MHKLAMPVRHRASGSPIERRVSGFSLVELAIVLIIVGLLLSSLMPPLSAQLDQKNYNATQQQIDEIRDAMIGFAVVNGRLPRPATSATDGTERASNCANDGECTGLVPWTTLGVRRVDAWNKLIRYSVTPAYSSTAAFNLTTLGSKKVQSRDSSGAISYLIGSGGGCGASACAPAVIYSSGKNNWGISADGIALPDLSATNADEDANEGATTSFFSREQGSVTIGGEFDDIVTWIPPYTLFNRMIAAGKLP